MVTIAVCGVALWMAAAASAAVPAQDQVVTDPHGRYTITIPPDWRPPFPRGPQDPGLLIVVEGPQRAGFAPMVTVQTNSLINAASPTKFAQDLSGYRRGYFPGYTLMQEGDATVAGRPAHFVYFTWTPQNRPALYGVQVYFTEGLVGWIVTGSTLKDAQHVHDDFPVITQIIGTFHVVQRTP